jgi:hypothetical protein
MPAANSRRRTPKTRKVIAGVTIGATLIAVVSAFILPGIAATPPVPIPPQSDPLHVTPTAWATGGQSTDCEVFGYSPTDTSITPFRIANPQNGLFSGVLRNGGAFTVELRNIPTTGKTKDKYFGFDITGGAAALDVGVKGGTQTARYSYSSAESLIANPSSPPQPAQLNVGGVGYPVTTDGSLHATLDSKNNLYNLSNVTFCLGKANPPISGTVTDGTSGAGLTGWTVRLYSVQNDVATHVADVSTNASGVYEFPNRPLGDYKVCIAKAGTWRQTVPGTSPTPPNCTGITPAPGNVAELPLGRAVSGTARTGINFGVVQTVTISGIVFRDANADGSPTGDGVLVRRVNLYSGAYNGGSYNASPVLRYTNSNSTTGAYLFTVDAGQYTVCLESVLGEGETLPNGGVYEANKPVDQWATKPTAGSVSCASPNPPNTSPNFYRGYGVGAQGGTALNFGTTPSVGLCSAPFGVPGYEIHLAEPCKVDQLFIVSFLNADDDNPLTVDKIASVQPIRTDLPPIPMVEKITWSLPGDGHQFKLVYDDTIPYGVPSTGPGDLAPKDMILCELDPRATGSDFTLSAPYNTVSASGSGAVLPGTETSCLISATTDVAAGTYEAYVYSAIDGWRSTP